MSTEYKVDQDQVFKFTLNKEEPDPLATPAFMYTGKEDKTKPGEYVGVAYEDNNNTTYVMVDTDNKTKTIVKFLAYLEEVKKSTENEEVLEKLQDCIEATEDFLQVVKNPPPEIKVGYNKEHDVYVLKLSYEAYDALCVYIDKGLDIDKNREKICMFLKEHIMDLIDTSIEN